MSFSLTSPEPPKPHNRRDDLGDDPTPRPVPRATFGACLGNHWESGVYIGDVEGDGCGLELERSLHGEDALVRVLDLGAGFGSWASELANHWVNVLDLPRELLHITGVELNPERKPDLAKWCDRVVIGDMWELMAEVQAAGDLFDLIIGNPDFSHVLRHGKHADPNKRTPYRPVGKTLVCTARRCTRALLLLHHGAAFCDSPHGRAVYRANLPAATWLCGRMSFRGDGKTDNRPYQATLWTPRHDGPAATFMLPELPPEDYKWRDCPPGAESAEIAEANGWPLAPGYVRS